MEKEIRIYVIDIQNQEIEMENAYRDIRLFMDIAEEQGRVYTLNRFIEAFNNEEINSNTDIIRMAEVKFNY